MTDLRGRRVGIPCRNSTMMMVYLYNLAIALRDCTAEENTVDIGIQGDGIASTAISQLPLVALESF